MTNFTIVEKGINCVAAAIIVVGALMMLDNADTLSLRAFMVEKIAGMALVAAGYFAIKETGRRKAERDYREMKESRLDNLKNRVA